MNTLRYIAFRNRLKVAALLSAALFAVPALAQDVAGQGDGELDRELLRNLQKQLQELKAENANVKAEVERLKTSQATGSAAFTPENADAKPAPAADGPITYNSKTGFIHFPGSGTKVKFGGYLKADVIYDPDTNRSGSGRDFIQPALIPLKGSPQATGNSFKMHARQTRIHMTTLTDTSLGQLKFFIEGDFFGTEGSGLVANGHSIQLRHAYGELGPTLFGQAWTNWMDLEAYPDTMDFVGPSGVSMIRQGQIRYTHAFSPKQSLAVSIENPATLDVVASGGGAALVTDEVPDMIARYTVRDDWGFVSLKGLLRKIDMNTTPPGNGDDKWGYGVGVTGRWNTWGKDNLRYQVAYGEGIGRYIFDVAQSANAAVSSGITGEVELSEVIAGYAAYQHFWTDEWRSNLILGHTEISNDATNGLDVNRRTQTAEFNIVWQPIPRYQVSLGYQYGHRETALGNEGTQNRIQWSHWILF